MILLQDISNVSLLRKRSVEQKNNFSLLPKITVQGTTKMFVNPYRICTKNNKICY